ncbi:unnamed protein product [Microthlaspi erraticum]|uniref:Uncharacterized protein n=1 Tax=Microthlaspi erraticum TaxID=1685480 RepID=A0A6D2JZE2_9BRAS|nr:unnamed protein product [Microthlaspi erraticum]
MRYMLKKWPTDLLAIFETHAGAEKARRICEGLGFEDSFRVDAVGQSGGIWLLWKKAIGDVVVLNLSEQFIHVRVTKNAEVMHVVVVYAAPSVSRRSGLWMQLRDLIRQVHEPLIIGGDFNTIVRVDERTGGNGRLSPDSLEFGSWINEMSLIDMGFRGNRFTWKRGREARFFVAKRLDRIMCCAQARLKWQDATVTHLPFLASDHSALYLQLTPTVTGDARRRPFRFEAAWLSHTSFKDLLSASWDPNLDTRKALAKLERVLRKWNKEDFGDVQVWKEKLLKEIQEVQEELESNSSDELIVREAELMKEFDVVLEQEEIIWTQKAREKWVVHGDRNTTFFHTSTVIRRRRNRIEMLKNGDGVCVSDRNELEDMAVEYFRRLYSLDDVEENVEALPSEGFTALTETETRALDMPFAEEEIVAAVRNMGSYKAPGPDGYQPVFYQRCWDEVGESVKRFALEFFRTGRLPQDTNDALVVLIPKVSSPEKLQQLRPISLCNVLFKIITKTIVGRLKPVMTKLIGPAQSSFIRGRLSTDNIVIVQEAVHSMRRKKGKRGWMLRKLDLEKAYDRIRWDFLEDSIRAARLSEHWTTWIMQCVSGPSMRLL